MTKRPRPILYMLTFIGMFFILILIQYSSSSNGKLVWSDNDQTFYTDSVATFLRSWRDYQSEEFDLKYSISNSNFRKSKEIKDNLPLPSYSNLSSYHEFWGRVYFRILLHEKHFIDQIADSLIQIRDQRKLDRTQFAEVIVSLVQDIPYSFVFQTEPCDTKSTPCITGQRFGIHTPTEFLYTLQGDCDSRSVILYGLLKRFGYDTRIAVSMAYQHALIVIDIQSSGAYLTHQNKKYYFWETTNEGWERGLISPDYSDVSNWHIAL